MPEEQQSLSLCGVVPHCSELPLAIKRCKNLLCLFICRVRLLLSGDVESNPGPGDLDIILESLRSIETGQDEIRSDLRALKSWQTSVDDQLKQLSVRLQTVEGDLVSIKSSGNSSSPESPEKSRAISRQLKSIEMRCEDAENRLRRCNLLFFGISDDRNESWSSSESKVINLCSEHLGIAIEPTQIERAHRLGQFNREKNRPIIAKYTFFLKINKA